MACGSRCTLQALAPLLLLVARVLLACPLAMPASWMALQHFFMPAGCLAHAAAVLSWLPASLLCWPPLPGTLTWLLALGCPLPPASVSCRRTRSSSCGWRLRSGSATFILRSCGTSRSCARRRSCKRSLPSALWRRSCMQQTQVGSCCSGLL